MNEIVIDIDKVNALPSTTETDKDILKMLRALDSIIEKQEETNKLLKLILS